MKKLLIAAVIMFAAISFSCKKNDANCCIPPYQPFTTAEKNGAKWDAAVSASKFKGDSVAIVGAQTEERLIMQIKFNGKGLYNLTGNQALFFTTVGQDVITSFYNVDNSTVSTLEITDYNNAKGTITGTYYVALKKEPNRYVGAPETIRFLKGRFTTYLKN
ncbi:DUF6252 family protein [Mucilaginibacter glaciei]|uniref:Uncharacterized protein n=1 Tax=Mucilaginibacter glaciei TaxID=2772109 RepID=A0A926NP59_9SPHI|nr:DUF6252 family protein [Mucilaginibacter glaciei]MBD1392838.1 hypothetical protein [Mucilaginibacter glaciei]